MNIIDKIINKKMMLEPASLMALYKYASARVVPMRETDQREVVDHNSITPMDNSGNIAVIDITGILIKGASPEQEIEYGICNIDKISQALDYAANDNTTTAIILNINSPGGETTGITTLGRKIKNLSANIPIYIWVDNKCASAAYWIASQGSCIGMTEDADIGCIGVYRIVKDLSKQYENEGVNNQVIYSGVNKMMGHDVGPLTTEQIELLQADVSEQHKKFKNTILANREVKPEAMEGLSYEGPQALDLGLCDIICDSLEDYLTYLNLV